jgi:hypothetical protein
MKIYGLDFSSNPSKSKRLTLAHCQLDNSTLAVHRLEELNTTTEGDYSKFCDWLAGKNGYGSEWVAGIDFPFGLPLEAIERFRWLKHDGPQSWTAYVEELYRDVENDLEKFRERVESWKKSGKTGKDKRVFLLRHTDKLSGFAGSTPSSPMKVHHQCNPPVGRMFFQGADRLRQAGVCIHPVRRNDCRRVVVEAYPRLVADKFIPGGKYKEGDDLSASREAIISGLAKQNDYQVTVTFAASKDRQASIDDEQGDKLDSVLSSVQAAWAYLSEQGEAGKAKRTHSYGVPFFSVACMNQIVELEGWIVDPLLLRSVSPKGGKT